MAENDLKVIQKAKELATHTLKVTSKGCRRDYIYSCTESASRQLKILA